MSDGEKVIKERLEYLRGEIRAERISYGELAELQNLTEYIDPSDAELLEWAGVPEEEYRRRLGKVKTCKHCGEEITFFVDHWVNAESMESDCDGAVDAAHAPEGADRTFSVTVTQVETFSKTFTIKASSSEEAQQLMEGQVEEGDGLDLSTHSNTFDGTEHGYTVTEVESNATNA